MLKLFLPAFAAAIGGRKRKSTLCPDPDLGHPTGKKLQQTMYTDIRGGMLVNMLTRMSCEPGVGMLPVGPL
jgi:hypothetical protein